MAGAGADADVDADAEPEARGGATATGVATARDGTRGVAPAGGSSPAAPSSGGEVGAAVDPIAPSATPAELRSHEIPAEGPARLSPARPRRWQPLRLDFDGPVAAETDEDPNPFLDYRLDVLFTGPSGQRYRVPGVFDGDGAGGARGGVWRARFTPDEAGAWRYLASFRAGEAVAIATDPDAGAPAAFDGAAGRFGVAPRDPHAPGFYKWGRLEDVGGHYRKFAQGPYFIKGGVDSPENFLEYEGFDNTVDQGGIGDAFLHRYGPHRRDWREGDPDWRAEDGGDGKGIIGALNYLGEVGVNSVYFLPMNLGGDGQGTYPFVGASGSRFDNTHYDLSKLAQWQQVFEHAQQQGILLHVVLGETEPANERWLDGGELGTERRLYLREMAARLGWALALKWNLGEESDAPASLLREIADALSDWSWAGHAIAVHNNADDYAIYQELLGDPRFTATSMQYRPSRAGALVETWRARSAEAGRPWVIDMDENNPAGRGLNEENAARLRREALYDVYFSGGQIEWYLGNQGLPRGGDLTLEDFRSRQGMWDAMRYARAFLQDYTPFWRMVPADELLSGEDDDYGGAEVLAVPGQLYAIYWPTASPAGRLDLSDAPRGAAFTLRWFDPRLGVLTGPEQRLTASPDVALGEPPYDRGADWVALVRARDYRPPEARPGAWLPFLGR